MVQRAKEALAMSKRRAGPDAHGNSPGHLEMAVSPGFWHFQRVAWK